MFHTQEKRQTRLKQPIPTINPDAWLGDAIYFWYDELDSVWWGRTAKKRYKYYEVYKADIDCKNILDTVFNEEHYKLWVKQIEVALKKFLRSQKTLSLKYLNDFFRDKGVYSDLDGVMFQDISNNPDVWIVNKFQYKKRIQLAVYNSLIISNFVFAFEGE